MTATLAGLPALEVLLDGAAIDPAARSALTCLQIAQRLDLPALCELTFVDPRGALGREGVTPGARLEVRAGDGLPTLFAGEVTAVEYCHGPRRSAELRVRGYDLLHRLRKRQPVRAHLEVTLADLARELTAELGVQVDGAGGPLWRHLIQHRQSDFELLLELAAREGRYLSLRGGTLRLLTLEGEGEAVPLLLGESLLEAQLEVNADLACRKIAASGWNTREVEPYQAEATRARSGRGVAAEVAPGEVGGSGQRALTGETTEGSDHAEGLAQAELDRRAAAEVVFRGVAAGDARLVPGCRVEVRGVAAPVAGRYVLTATTHRIDAVHGFVTELSSAPPPPRARPRGASVALGVVTRVDSESGRVKVQLPAHGEVETDWLQVAAAGAGTGKGLTLLPDLDDQVLLLCPSEEPAQAVVLGGLHGRAGPPDAGVEGGGVRRFSLHTRGGHRVTFDDGNHSLRLQDTTGSVLELAPEGVKLSSKVPLTLEAPGQAITIRGHTVDFQRG